LEIVMKRSRLARLVLVPTVTAVVVLAGGAPAEATAAPAPKADHSNGTIWGLVDDGMNWLSGTIWG
jgi:hypothetical protein